MSEHPTPMPVRAGTGLRTKHYQELLDTRSTGIGWLNWWASRSALLRRDA